MKINVKSVIYICFFAVTLGNVLSYTQIGITFSFLPLMLRSFMGIATLLLFIYLAKNNHFSILKSNIDIVFFCLWLILISPFGLSPMTAIIYSIALATSLFVINYYVYFTYNDLSKTLKPIFYTYGIIVVLSFIVSVLGLESAIYYRGSQPSWNGLFGNVNFLGLTSTVAFSISLALIVLSEKKTNLFIIIVLIISAICSVMSFSRASMLACAASLLIFFIFSKISFFKKIVIFIAVWIASAIFNKIIGFTDIINRMSSVVEDSGQRTLIWSKNIDYVMQNPISSAGLTGSQFIPTVEGYTPHNSFIQIVSETGVIGTILFFVIFLRLIIDLIIIGRNNKKLATAVLIILTGVIVNGMSESQILLPSTALFIPFWVIVFLTRRIISTPRTE